MLALFARRATSIRRWRLTSAATAASASASDQRGAPACWRGNAVGLGGWAFVTRISLATLHATGMAFFGLYGSTAALATTLALSAVVSCIGIGFQRGTYTASLSGLRFTRWSPSLDYVPWRPLDTNCLAL